MKLNSILIILLSVFSSLALLAEESDLYTIKDSSKYFTFDGQTRYYTGRTPHESTLELMAAQFDIAAAAGEKIIRLAGIHIGLGYKYLSGWQDFMTDGTPNTAFFNQWDQIFEAGAQRGLHFCVVLDIHPTWQISETASYKFDVYNIFHVDKKGPADDPLDILKDDATQEKYLEYIKLVIQKMSKHENIFTWEMYSEINVSFRGAPDDLEREYIQECDTFFKQVYRVIHENDPLNRPVQISLAEQGWGVPIGEWENALFGNDSICDHIEVHSYPRFGAADPPGPENDAGLALNNIELRNRNLKHNKLVFVGECELGLTADVDYYDTEGIDIEYRKSLWSNMVFGISNGGMWWFHSGKGGAAFADHKNKWPLICKPINDFVKDIDFTGMNVLATGHEEQVIGSAIGNKEVIIGYFWNEVCKYNYYSPSKSWPTDIETTSTVSLEVSHQEFFNTRQAIYFFNPEDLALIKTDTISVSEDGVINMSLPTFTSDIAFSIGYRYLSHIVHVPSVVPGNAPGDISSQAACENISVYLNPATDVLHVTNSNVNTETAIIVYSASGIKLKEVNGNSMYSEISIADLQRGIYIILVRNPDSTCATKFLN